MAFTTRGEVVKETVTERETHYVYWPRRCMGCASLYYPGGDFKRYDYFLRDEEVVGSRVVDSRLEHFTDPSDGYSQTTRVDSIEKDYKVISDQITTYLCKGCLPKAQAKRFFRRFLVFLFVGALVAGGIVLTITVQMMFVLIPIMVPIIVCYLAVRKSMKNHDLPNMYFEINRVNPHEPIKYKFRNNIMARCFQSLNPSKHAYHSKGMYLYSGDMGEYRDTGTLGVISYLKKDYSKAIEHFSSALKHGFKEDVPTIKYNLGWSYLLSNNIHKALINFADALRKDKKFSTVFPLSIVKDIISKDHKNIEIYSYAGEIFYFFDELDQALLLFENFLAVCSDFYRQLTVDLIFQRKRELEISNGNLISYSLKMESKIHYLVAKIYSKKGMYNESSSHFNDAFKKYPFLVPPSELVDLKKEVERWKIKTKCSEDKNKQFIRKNDLLTQIKNLLNITF